MGIRRTTIITITTASLAICQNPRPGDQPPGQTVPSRGTITAELHPREEVTSLSMAIKMASLIVQAKVVNTLPSINRNINIPQTIETHSILHVEKVLSGKLPTGGDTIVLAQEGG
jgi:hypothetical protein